MKIKLESHFGEDVILSGIRGENGMLLHPGQLPEKIFERFLKSAKENDGGGGGGGGGGSEAYK